MFIFKIIALFCEIIQRGYNRYVLSLFFKARLGYCGRNVIFMNTNHISSKVLSRVYLYDNVVLKDFNFISAGGKFVMKKNSGTAINLTVITGNHQRTNGLPFLATSSTHKYDIEKDVIVEEDVWIGANVTLLSGVRIGRGATVGAGSVCIKNIPPYAIVMGNPAKVVGFNYTPEEIVEHEKKLYDVTDRLPVELLQSNYDKYFINKIKDIKQFTKL